MTFKINIFHEQDLDSELNLRFVRIYYYATTFDRITKDRAAKFVDKLSAIGCTMGSSLASPSLVELRLSILESRSSSKYSRKTLTTTKKNNRKRTVEEPCFKLKLKPFSQLVFFCSDRSPRRQDLGCLFVRPCYWRF